MNSKGPGHEGACIYRQNWKKGGGDMDSEQQTVMYVKGAHYELEGGPNSINRKFVPCQTASPVYLIHFFMKKKKMKKIILLCLS